MTSELPSPNDLILVAIMPSPRDLEIAKTLGWYRIPLRTAPRVVAVDYLAFYQPASFGEDHRWRIEYIAEVKGHEMVTRAEILKDQEDHPHANEEYFKLQLGAMQKLKFPIPANKWKRINFIYTSGEKFLSAESIQDLGVRDEERQLLWRALKERAEESNQYGVRDLPELAIDPEILAMLGFGLVPQVDPQEDK